MIGTRQTLSVLLVCVGFFISGQTAKAQGYRIIDLGPFSPNGINNAQLSTNGLGQVVGSQTNGSVTQTVIWSGGNLQPIGSLGGAQKSSYGNAINDSGWVCGQSQDSAGYLTGFFYNGSFRQEGGNYATANGLNNAANLVGRTQYMDFDGNLYIYGIGWLATGIVTPWGKGADGTISSAAAINNKNDIAGYVLPQGKPGSYASVCLATGSTYGAPYKFRLDGDTSAIARSLNDADQVVGQSSNSSTGAVRGFIFNTAALPVPVIAVLPPLAGGAKSSAYSINNVTGNVAITAIVGYAEKAVTVNGTTSVVARAAMWTQNSAGNWVATDLNDLLPTGSGWSNLSVATGINNAGQIVGTGTYQGQVGHAFMLTPPLQGVDMSTVPGSSDWANIFQYFTDQSLLPSFVIADAWGGKNEKPAQQIFDSADIEFLLQGGSLDYKGAYCYLNFFNESSLPPPSIPGANNETGQWQVGHAIHAIGTQLDNLQFIAIDVEPTWWTSLAALVKSQAALPSMMKSETLYGVNDPNGNPLPGIIFSPYPKPNGKYAAVPAAPWAIRRIGSAVQQVLLAG